MDKELLILLTMPLDKVKTKAHDYTFSWSHTPNLSSYINLIITKNELRSQSAKLT